MKTFPWCDRSGRFSPLKAATFAGLWLPALVAAIDLLDGSFAAEPAKQTIHALGLWTIRLILLALAVTPAMQIFRLPRLIQVRRMVGVAAFAYGAAHLCTYVVQQNFDLARVAHEIGARFYLALGFSALLMLAALAATSTDAMIRKMGARRWALLHRAVYVAAVLGLVHYFIQSKLVVTEPTIFAGLFLWLMLYRAVLWTAGARAAARPQTLALIGVTAAVLTMIAEAAGYALFTPVDGLQVLSANFTFIAGLRPGWVVLFFGVGVTSVAVTWARAAMFARPLLRSAVR